MNKQLEKEKEMKDGTIAFLSLSRKYYVRRKPDSKEWKTITYYDLEGNHIPLAKGQCGDCGEVLESKHCGDFVGCHCGESFVDTDRWFPERHRYGGQINQVS